MEPNPKCLRECERILPSKVIERIDAAVKAVVDAKQRGGKVIVVTGSGPNVHEGVTTLVAELMRVGIVDGVSTSSAVIAHELGGVLDRVKRVDGASLGIEPSLLPRGGHFEQTVLSREALDAIRNLVPFDDNLWRRLNAASGTTIIKAAGNLGYPMGLYIERIARDVQALAQSHRRSFEETAGLGADPRTMLGASAARGLPVVVTIPQLVGGGAVGLAIGDTITITERAKRLAAMLESADVIIESAVALTQEVHDGPFETYTGHGLWASWGGHSTYSLEGKTLVRIDLDPALETVWQSERGNSAVQEAIDKGLPKTKLFKTPFRMEMSGFARLEGSLPITADIGAVWPVMASRIAQQLGIELEFMSYPQHTEAGKEMRDWIVEHVAAFNRGKMMAAVCASVS
ncbi:MAG TPA: hypothetical protein PLM14_10195 [Candidatus Hydrogenedentes bacterium]|nr:hypothetical protein [Candidatus Hydrogenedentota bacterium]